MPSPLLHSAAGAAICLLDRVAWREQKWRFVITVVGAALAPDLDILPGLFLNDANRFHRMWSHSIGAGLLFAAAATLLLSNKKLGLYAAAGFFSHLLLDLFCVDMRPVNGIPLLWPLSGRMFIGSPVFLGAFQHGGADVSRWGFLREIATWDNLVTLGTEVLVAVPLLGICAYLGKVIDSRRSRCPIDVPALPL